MLKQDWSNKIRRICQHPAPWHLPYIIYLLGSTMLNRAEFAQLQSTALSHMARTLYVFYLQPQVRRGLLQVDPIALTKALVSISQYAPCTPSLEDVEHALLELEQQHLIARNAGSITWQNATISLPLFVSETNDLPMRPFRMMPSWQPSASFATIALQGGLSDYNYQDAELQEFVNFWLSRNFTRTQQGWERSFVSRLLKVRSAQSVRRPVYTFNPHPQYSPPLKRDEAYWQQLEQEQNSKRNKINYSLRSVKPTEPSYSQNSYVTTPQKDKTQEQVKAQRTPTLFSLATGKEDYELTAPGYTDPAVKEQIIRTKQGNEQALSLGYEPLTNAPGYTDPKMKEEAPPTFAPEEPSKGFDESFLRELHQEFNK